MPDDFSASQGKSLTQNLGKGGGAQSEVRTRSLWFKRYKAFFQAPNPLPTFWQNIINKIKISRRFLNKKVLHYVVDIFKGISHVAFHILANNLHNPAFNPIAKPKGAWIDQNLWARNRLADIGKREISDKIFRLFLKKWKTHCNQLFGNCIKVFLLKKIW